MEWTMKVKKYRVQKPFKVVDKSFILIVRISSFQKLFNQHAIHPIYCTFHPKNTSLTNQFNTFETIDYSFLAPMKKIISFRPSALFFLLISVLACSPEDGTDGLDGMDGSDGTNGLNSLLSTTTEEPGENCANGGFRLDFGLDSNTNGTLDTEEITSSEYLCNTNPSDGLTSLVSTIIEQPGANCINGGYRLDVGLDINSNGMLDAEEVSNSEYLCNGDQADFTYQSYASLISQTGTNDPTVQVLENGLGLTITWTRESQGVYVGTLDAAIDISKTVIFFSTPATHTGVRGELLNDTQIRLELQSGINAFADNFENLSFELREYK
jgi:hypothetical protein